MKTKLVGILGIVVVLAVAGACASGVQANRDISINVPVEEFANSKHIARHIEVEQGGVLVVILGSNPSTGFSWTETAHLSDPVLIEQTRHEYVSAGQTGQPVLGAATQEHWTFSALKSGTVKLTLAYSQPWTGGAINEWTFELTVVVK